MRAKGEREMGNRGREIYLPALEGGGPQIFCGDDPWRALEMSARGSRMSAGADGARERERAGAGGARERERAGRRRELARKRKGSGGGVRDPWTRCVLPIASLPESCGIGASADSASYLDAVSSLLSLPPQ